MLAPVVLLDGGGVLSFPAPTLARMSRHRGLDADTRLTIALEGTALRHAKERTPDHEAIADLRLIAAGRADLAGVALGGILGGYMASPGTKDPNVVTAAALLARIADPDTIAASFDQTRANASGGRHSTPTDSDDDQWGGPNTLG